MIGKKIREAISNSGKSLQDVAIEMGISQSNLYTIMRKDHIDTRHLEQFSQILELPIAYFFDDYETPVTGKSLTTNKAKQSTEDELRKQIEILKDNNKFLQSTVSRLLELKEEDE